MKRSIFLFALLATGIMFCSGKNNVMAYVTTMKQPFILY